MRDPFYVRLRMALESRGMKAVDLVNATGIPKSAISFYLSGKSEPRSDRLYIIAKALEVSEAWLLGIEGAQMEVSEAERESDRLADLINELKINSDLRQLCFCISKLPSDRLGLIRQLVDSMT